MQCTWGVMIVMRNPDSNHKHVKKCMSTTYWKKSCFDKINVYKED